MSDTYVLVHGAWHTGSLMEPTAEHIRHQGHTVHCPTLKGNRPGDDRSQIGLEDAAQSVCDYLREYEEKMAKEHVDQVRTDLRVSVYDEIQTPILIGVLFFLFQVPFLNALMFKYLGFLKIYSDDGNLNLYGLLFKSMLFGAVYFGFVKMTTFL